MISIMPCTAKKFQAQRPEFTTGGPDVDFVITTQELADRIREQDWTIPLFLRNR